VSRQLDYIARENPSRDLRVLVQDPRIGLVLADAIAQAQSILHVAVLDTNGVAVAHSLSAEVGKEMAHHPPIPHAQNLVQSIAALWDLRKIGQNYEHDTALVVDGHPFAMVRIVVTRTFLWESVKEALRHGLVIAVVVFSVAIAAGAVLSRVAVGRIQALEAGVAAIREGRFESEIPETGAEEFRRLVRELNLLGAQMSRARSESGRTGVDQTRLLVRLGEMAAGVAHELRDPLQTLSLELDAVLRAAKGAPAVEEHVKEARRKVNRLDRAIRGFLTVARLRPPTSEPLDIDALLREVHDELEPDANLAGLELVRERSDEALNTRGDKQVLRQALHNLVKNSIQAQPTRDGRVVLRCGRSNGSIWMSVEDTGPGMSPAVLEKAFDLFFTTKSDGTGVGMALVRQAVELHGGDVEVRSRPDEGTVVTMRLPAGMS
jgi:signal transduction histidine kinase